MSRKKIIGDVMYEALAQFAQTWGLVLFVIAFVLVLIYALNPKNQKKFDQARQIPLDDGGENESGADNGAGNGGADGGTGN